MPSQAMQELIDAFRDAAQASASRAPAPLEERRAAFAHAGRLHPVPGDVLVTEVDAAGVPAHWLAAPGTDADRVLLFLRGLPHVYQLLLGTPEAAQATERIGKFLRARPYSSDSPRQL
jgi:hypothetical protein